MEFDNAGKHCEHPSCNQQDFLPFQCKHCRKSYCVVHKGMETHGCGGTRASDMTSVDCPICGNSVKFRYPSFYLCIYIGMK